MKVSRRIVSVSLGLLLVAACGTSSTSSNNSASSSGGSPANSSSSGEMGLTMQDPGADAASQAADASHASDATSDAGDAASDASDATSDASDATSDAGDGGSAFDASDGGGRTRGTVCGETTLNSNDKQNNIVVSIDKLTASEGATGSVNDSIRATRSHTRGRWYYEVTLTALSATSGWLGFGVGSASEILELQPGSTAEGCNFDGNNVQCAGGALISATGGLRAGDVVQVATDLDANQFYVGVNGTWRGGGNPTALTGGATILRDAGVALFPMIDLSDGDSFKANFGQSAFRYPVPAPFAVGWYDDCASDPGPAPATGSGTCASGAYTSIKYSDAAVYDVHFVSIYGATTVAVNVSASAKPVVLVLDGNLTNTWNINPVPGATINAVYTLGSSAQTVSGYAGTVRPLMGTSTPTYFPTLYDAQVRASIESQTGLRVNTGRGCFGGATATMTLAPP